MVEKLEQAGPLFACALQNALHDVEACNGDRQTDALYQMRRITCEIVLLVSENKLNGFTICGEVNDLMAQVAISLKGPVGNYEEEVNLRDVGCVKYLCSTLVQSLTNGCLKRDYLEAQDTEP